MVHVHQELNSCCLKMNQWKDSHLAGQVGEPQTNLYQNSQEQSFTEQILTNLSHKYKYYNSGLKYK